MLRDARRCGWSARLKQSDIVVQKHRTRRANNTVSEWVGVLSDFAVTPGTCWKIKTLSKESFIGIAL